MWSPPRQCTSSSIRSAASFTTRRFAETQGRDYDLVVMDYNLGLGDRMGAAAARDIRRVMPYTDMAFYSSDPPPTLRTELAALAVDGVFVTSRTGLSDALVGLAETMIRKTVDTTQMRGIAMAEVAEMEVQMEAALRGVSKTADDRVTQAAQRICERRRAELQNTLDGILQHIEQGTFRQVLEDSHFLSFAQRYFLVRRIAKTLNPRPIGDLNTLGSFDRDVIEPRNLLAHAQEARVDGQPVLRTSMGVAGDTVIDENWMVDFRNALRTHRSALGRVCDAILAEFATAVGRRE